MAQPDLATYTGRRGNTLTVGQYLRDKRPSNTRTLRIDRLYEDSYGSIRGACTIVGVDGILIDQTRTTDVDAIALAGPGFLPASAPIPANASEETHA